MSNIDPQEWISLVAEWSAGVNSVILSDRNNSLVTGNFSDVLAHLFTWMDQSIIDSSAFADPWEKLLESFSNRHDVFVHADPSNLLDMTSIKFDWDIAPMPGFTVSYTDDDSIVHKIPGIPSGTLTGSYIGVNRNSKNLAGAVKSLNQMTSLSYQRELITTMEFHKWYLLPSYLSLLLGNLITLILDKSFCQQTQGMCGVYEISTTALRPSTIAGKNYANVSKIVADEMKLIMTGQVDLGSGIKKIDTLIRKLSGVASTNATLDDDDVRVDR